MSETLVPGDVVNLSSSSLSTVPADMFLLSGDAIVNESMLTGESVPVSKIPVADGNLARWKDAKDVDSEAAKSFLYSGTHVIRIRGSFGSDTAQGRPALALVARIGKSMTHLYYLERSTFHIFYKRIQHY
jgi:cation-transporting P-type ATPase 13A2